MNAKWLNSDMYLNRGLPKPLRYKFDKVFQQNLFHGLVSKSGNGSSIEQTHEISRQLPDLISNLNIQSILDIPCGDLEWMSKIELNGAKYLGSDVAPSLIAHLEIRFPEKEFSVLDISKDSLPTVDLIFCRDLFVHLSNQDIKLSLRNIKKSKSTYFATTTFVNRESNKNLPYFTRGVAWRTLNMEIAPFYFPKPQVLINEKCTEDFGGYSDKSLGVWLVKSLPDY